MSQEKLKTMFMQNFGGQTERIIGNAEMANRDYPQGIVRYFCKNSAPGYQPIK